MLGSAGSVFDVGLSSWFDEDWFGSLAVGFVAFDGVEVEAFFLVKDLDNL